MIVTRCGDLGQFWRIEAPRSLLRGIFTVRNRTNLYTLANPAASCGECARLIGSLGVTSAKAKNLPCCLPFGKADDTAALALSRVRRSILQPHPRRLGPAASSTFATLGYIVVKD
jgi:hypothetical protein